MRTKTHIVTRSRAPGRGTPWISQCAPSGFSAAGTRGRLGVTFAAPAVAPQVMGAVRGQTLFETGMLIPSDNRPAARTIPARWVRITAVFLAISYGLGAPAAAFLEFQRHLLSLRFHYSPALIYLVCAVQVVCGITVLVPRFASRAAAGLTVTTIGAVASHIRIGSPLTAVPALIYTVVQVWFWFKSRRPPSAA
jgi:DoxX-like family